MKIKHISHLIHAFVLLIAALLSANISYAQLSIGSPSPLKVNSCDDFATAQFNDPWDMSNYADINYRIPNVDLSGFTSFDMSFGRFFGTTLNDNNYFYLFSPLVTGSHAAGGRFGENFSLDVAKYNTLTVRMSSSVDDPLGLRILFHRGQTYTANRSMSNSNLIPIRAGWNNYTVDLNSLALVGDNVQPWSAGNIKGLALRTTHQTGSDMQVDYVRLEDPTSCSTPVSIPYATTASSYDLMSTFLDDDSNPFNGYYKQLDMSQTALVAGTISVNSAVGLAPAGYYINGFVDSDYATLERVDPWDMSTSGDVLVTSAISGGTFAGGTFSGISTSHDPNIYLKVLSSGINANKYKILTFKVSRTGNSLMALFWSSGAKLINPATDQIAADTYSIDLSGEAGWSGNISEIILRPVTESGQTFSLDWVALRSSGTQAADSASVLLRTVSSGTTLTVNAPPLIDMLEPDIKGGEAIKPWNMNSGDTKVYSNLSSAVDSSYPQENRTTYLPDVRTVAGIRGDFFKGTNISPSDDPVQYSQFPTGQDDFTFAADEYHNLCFKLFIDYPFILTAIDGSMARVLWKEANSSSYESTGAYIVGANQFEGNGWTEFCDDMSTLETASLENGSNWNNIISEFRVDAHEITQTAPYYFDYIKIRRDDRSTTGNFTVPYHLSDSDDASPTLSLFANTTPSTTGGIPLASRLTKEEGVIILDTSSLANGTYYLYAVASDGYNENRRLASGKLIVARDLQAVKANPVLQIEAPNNGDIGCDYLQVKGYSLMSSRFEEVAAVQVFIDNTLFDTFKPSDFSLNAKTAYPGADSSNTGFNRSYSLASVAPGAHNVIVKSFSTDGGQTSETRTITKAAAGCTAFISDPAPAGLPVVISIPTPAATSTPVPNVNLSLSGKIKSKVNIELSMGNTQRCSSITLTASAVTQMTSATTLYSGAPTVSKISVSKVHSYLKPKKKKAGEDGKIFFQLSCPQASAAKKISINFAKVKSKKKTNEKAIIKFIGSKKKLS